MGVFRQFPYSNFHEMNMDEIIKIMREMQDEWAATKTEWASYKDYIDNYFKNLDVSQEVLEALRILAADGTLNQIIDPTIASETAEWLSTHITPTTPVVDNSLSIAGAAADAKATGRVRNNLSGVIQIPYNSKVVYDIANKSLTIPQGFIVYDSFSYALAAQSVTIPNSLNGVLWYDRDNRVIVADAYNTENLREHTNCVGAFYGRRIWINGIENIEVVGNINILPDYGTAFIGNQTGSFTFENGIISIPQGFWSYEGTSLALQAQTVDVSGGATAYILQVETQPNTHVVATPFNQRITNAPIVGYVYDKNVVINGLGGTYSKANFAMMINVLSNKNQSAGIFYYDRANKKLTFKEGGYAITGSGIRINVPMQTVDISNITATYDAYQILLDNSGNLSAKAWNDNSYTGKYIIGSVFQNSINIIGNVHCCSDKQRVAVFGDSLVAGTGCYNPFHELLCAHYGNVCLNYGVGSTGFVTTTSSEVVKGIGNLGKGVVVTESGNNNVYDVISDTTFDSAMLFAGTNDYGNSIPLSSFRSAVQNVLDTLLSSTSNILVITPVHRLNDNNPNSQGATLSEYGEVIIEECRARSIPWIDGFDIPINANIANHRNRFYNDNIHPNDAGHRIIAGYVSHMFATMFNGMI